MHCIGWDQPLFSLPASPQGSQADHLQEYHQVILASLIISLATCRLVGVTRLQLTAEPDWLSGVSTLGFITDFPQLKELFIHMEFERFDSPGCRSLRL